MLTLIVALRAVARMKPPLITHSLKQESLQRISQMFVLPVRATVELEVIKHKKHSFVVPTLKDILAGNLLWIRPGIIRGSKASVEGLPTREVESAL